MDKTRSFPHVYPCSKVKRLAGLAPIAAFVLAVSATPADTAEIFFSGLVINPDQASFTPASATMHIAGSRAIFDVAVSSPQGLPSNPEFTATDMDGTNHPVRVLKARRNGNALLARLQLGTGGGKRQKFSICFNNPAARHLCGSFTINHLY